MRSTNGEPEDATEVLPVHRPTWPVLGTSPPKVADHELLRLIGRGSYGEVWLARNIMGSYRAVKIVYRDTFEDDRPYNREFAGIQKFEPISRTHESQVAILHVGQAEGCFYYVMELADDAASHWPASGELNPETYQSRTLKSELDRRGSFSGDACIELGLALTTALAHLHSNGLVHRDIKPSNIIYVNGLPKLADIGLVSAVDATRSMVGTIGFAPPEGPGTPEADIYSLGKVLYECATGRDRQNFPELPTSLSGTAQEQIALIELNEVLLNACDVDPKGRYRTAERMHEDLLLLRSGKSLIRLRTTERRLVLAKRFGAAAVLATLLAIFGYAFQSRQNSHVRILASENLRLAEQARREATQSKERLVKLQVANGVQLMDAGDSGNALLWFSEALKSVDSTPELSAAHRYRIGALLRYFPKPIALFQDKTPVTEARYSPSEETILLFETLGPTNLLTVLKAESAEFLYQFSTTNGSKIVSLDGKVALTFADSEAQVWDARSGQKIGPPMKHPAPIDFIVPSPDGKQMATGAQDKRARIWSIPDGTLLGVTQAHTNKIQVIRFNPKGDRIVTGDGLQSPDLEEGGGSARVWNSANGAATTDWLAARRGVYSVGFSPDGGAMFAAPDWVRTDLSGYSFFAVNLWDISTGNFVGSFGHFDSIADVVFSPDGNFIATAGSDHTVAIWDARTGKPVGMPIPHEEILQRVAFSPDGRWLATATPESVRIWDVETRSQIIPILRTGSPIVELSFSRDGTTLLTVTRNGLVRLWNLIPLEPGAVPLMPGDKTLCVWVTFDPEGSHLAAQALDGSLETLNLRTGARLRFAEIQDATTNHTTGDLACAPAYTADGGKILAHAWDGSIRIWDSLRGKEISSPLGNSVYSFAFNPLSRLVATSSFTNSVSVWSTETSGSFTAPLLQNEIIGSARISPDGRKLLTMALQTAYLWDVQSRKQLDPILRTTDRLMDAQFSPDGKMIATASTDGKVRLWETDTGRLIEQPLVHPSRYIERVRFSPDGKVLLTICHDNAARLWNVQSLQMMFLMAHSNYVNDAAFSPEGRRIVTGSVDRTARVWSATTGEPLTPPFHHFERVTCVRFSPDGKTIAAASLDMAQLWEVPLNSWPVDEIAAWAEFLSNGAIDESIKIKPVSAGQLVQTWNSRGDQHPEFRAPTLPERKAWHRRQAEIAKELQNWSVAEIHSREALALAPEDSDLIEQHEQVMARRPPIRDPSASPRQIDLSKYYNASPAVGWAYDMPGNNLAEFPRGLGVYADTLFDARGIVRVFNQNQQPYFGKRYPEKLKGIRIEHKCVRIHLLHGSSPGTPKEGTEIGKYVFHYRNGIRKEVPIVYGVNVKDWWAAGSQPENLPNARIAWSGNNRATREYHRSLQLYKMTVDNVFPEVEITTLDLMVTHADVAPFLLAVTVE